MLRSFDSLREQLLRAGIAPRRVRRYVVELREHLSDLAECGRASGLNATQAHGRAMLLLGGDAELAQAMIQSVPRLSLAARAPWMVFVMWPTLLLVAATFLSALLLIRLLWPVQGLTPAEMPANYRTLLDLANVVINYVVVGVLSASCITVALRQRLASGWIWVGLGFMAVFSGCFGFHMHVVPPAGGHAGDTSYSLAGLVFVDGHVNSAATFAAAALHAGTLFAMTATSYALLRTRISRVHS
ncbi:MAG TPA: hypothetical protein VGV09_21730 [Steroidobacteraceae bacterium]|nr:hypothetical protein [Steroidobacteraceae bacterium]